MTRTHLFGTLAPAFAGVLLAATPAQADFIVQPVSGTASSSYSAQRSADAAINGNGFTTEEAEQVQTGDSIPVTWPTHSPWGSDNYLSASGDETPTLTFDLGQAYDLTGFHLWNSNEVNYTDRGFNEVTISFSLDNVTFADGQTFTFAQAPGSASYAGESYAFTVPVTAQYVRIEVTSNHGSSNYSSVSEIRFAAVPEPASMALTAAGVLLILRRRPQR